MIRCRLLFFNLFGLLFDLFFQPFIEALIHFRSKNIPQNFFFLITAGDQKIAKFSLRQQNDLEELFGIQLQQIFDEDIYFIFFADLFALFSLLIIDRQPYLSCLIRDSIAAFFG